MVIWKEPKKNMHYLFAHLCFSLATLTHAESYCSWRNTSAHSKKKVLSTLNALNSHQCISFKPKQGPLRLFGQSPSQKYNNSGLDDFLKQNSKVTTHMNWANNFIYYYRIESINLFVGQCWIVLISRMVSGNHAMDFSIAKWSKMAYR